MIEANTSYKQNGVPVSIPSGSYGIAPLTVHQYEYPKGHPCHNCPYTLRTSVPSCMFPERRDGGCLWYDLKKQRRPPLPAVYPKNQAAAERIFNFLDEPEIVEKTPKYTVENSNIRGDIRFDHVCEIKPIFTGCSLNSLPGAALM